MTPLLREGETCWKTARAERVAFLVDGEAFFGAVADALEQAQQSVWLIGWDFHSAVRLRRDDAAPEGSSAERPDKGQRPDKGRRPVELVAMLDSLVRERRSLRVRVLAWDFAMLYALEREFLPLLQFGARTHRRIDFATDSAHPLTASQHQKLVVVDDSIAFAGGFDLTAHRWDTREHRPDDPRRVTPSDKPYAPFHDVQIAVDGDAASLLAMLARERWLRATGKRVRPTRRRPEAWPPSLEPHLRDVRVGVARTLPSYRGEPEVREVEALYRESIAAAKRWIFIENQYLTSPAITEWLAERLREPDGPELVIVGPRENSGWLEENTMGALRDRAVHALRSADRGERLRVLYPDTAGLPPDQMINVHSKVMVVDDAFARVGSSNLSNRSMGLDAECDVALEASDEDLRLGIARFRNDLLAEHLGTTPELVAKTLERTESLVQTVDELLGGERTLRPVELESTEWTATAVDALGTVDPEHPVPLEELVMRFERDAEVDTRAGRPPWLGVAVLAGLVVGLTVLWQATPLGDWLTTERLSATLAFFRGSWLGVLAAVAFFTFACLVMAPVIALTVAASLALGPGLGILVAWIGCTAASAIGYVAGRSLWRESVRRLAGDRLNALSKRLAQRGMLSSALLRVVPIAPFMVVNLVAGASHVRARDFIVGTALGILPGTLVLALAADGIHLSFSGPEGPEWLRLALVSIFAVGLVVAARRLLARRRLADWDDA